MSENLLIKISNSEMQSIVNAKNIFHISFSVLDDMKPIRSFIPNSTVVQIYFYFSSIKLLQDLKGEMPDDFLNELHKWSLECMCLLHELTLKHMIGI